RFTASFSATEAATAPLIFEAQADATTTYRIISFARLGAGGGSGLDGAEILLGPSSEAAVRLLAENGLQNFSASEVAEIIDAVGAATENTDFSASAPEEAAVIATDVARTDPEVVMIIEQSLATPAATASSTPTATSTATPTPTATSGGSSGLLV